VVLARRDIGTSYHLSVVVDDAAQGITEVTRGADLFEATDPCPAATPAGPADANLSPSPPDPRRGRQAAGQARRCARAGEISRRRGNPCRPADIRGWSAYRNPWGAMISTSSPVAQGGVETGPPVGVAGRAGLIHQHQQAIAVAIDPHLHQALHMARGFALGPERLRATATSRSPARGQRARHGFRHSSRPSSAPRPWHGPARWRGSGPRHHTLALPGRRAWRPPLQARSAAYL
jgi:hypothetical protein